MFRKYTFITSLLLLLLAGCGEKEKTPDNEYLITINTSEGKIVAILHDETPMHKANFIKLAQEHFYDSTVFHRVIQGFMIQGGDPNSKRAQPSQEPDSDGPGYTLEAEFNSRFFHEKGAIAAARISDGRNPERASNGSQFYIVHGRRIPEGDFDDYKIIQSALTFAFDRFLSSPENKSLADSLLALYSKGDIQGHQRKIISLIPRVERETGIKITREFTPEKINVYNTVGGVPHLDGDYTVFGKVISGLDIVDKIATRPTDGADRPVEDVRMFVSVKLVPKKKITKEYGYVFPN